MFDDKILFDNLINSFGVYMCYSYKETKDKKIIGALVPFSKSAIDYYNSFIQVDGGKLDSKDRKLFTVEKLEKDGIVSFNDNNYKIVNEREYSEIYSDVNIYELKYIKPFESGGEHGINKYL